MPQSGAYGQGLAAAMKVKSAASFISGGGFTASKIAVTEIRQEGHGEHHTSPLPPEDGLLVMSQLRPWTRRLLWEDGRPVDTKPLEAGATTIFDLRKEWVGLRTTPVHYLCFYLPRAALIDVAAADGILASDVFPNDYLSGNDDRIISNLARVLQPAFARPAEANPLFVDHVATAVCAHVLRGYGAGEAKPISPARRLPRQGLARVQEAISANLDGDLTVASLAGECGMAASDFVQAFEETTGLAPHQWLLRRRIDRALDLMKNPKISAGAAIAAAGFASIAHFLRVRQAVSSSRSTRSRR